MCGEQKALDLGMFWTIGSPPRVRGTGQDATISMIFDGITPACAGNSFPFIFSLVYIRITPACAGNSATSGQIEYSDQDHPRVCGEQLRNTLA